MSDYPDDIREKAIELAARIDSETAWGSDDYGIRHDEAVEIIAAALLAERERCAKIAEDEDGHFSHFGEDRNTRVAQQALKAAAAAIRSHRL